MKSASASFGQLVQVQRPVHLRGHDCAQALAVKRFDHAVVEHARGVDHRGQGRSSGDRGEQPLQRGAIGDIAGGDCHLAAELLQGGLQLAGALGLLAAAA